MFNIIPLNPTLGRHPYMTENKAWLIKLKQNKAKQKTKKEAYSMNDAGPIDMLHLEI